MKKIEEELKDRVTRLRKEANHTQESLAKLARVSTQTIKDIENGRNPGGMRSLSRISKALGMSIEALVGEATGKPVERVENVTPGKFIKMLSNIPDDVFELAQYVDTTDDAWDTVRSALEIVKEKKQAQKKKTLNQL